MLRGTAVAARSIAVGAAATAFDLLLLFLLVDVAGVDARTANVPALLGGLAAQFVGNKIFAFQDRTPRWVKQGLLFGLVEVGALVLNALLFDLSVARFELPYGLARIGASALVYFCFSLPLWSRIFSAPKEAVS